MSQHRTPLEVAILAGDAEGDEGRLLVFASGKGFCEYAGSGW